MAGTGFGGSRLRFLCDIAAPVPVGVSFGGSQIWAQRRARSTLVQHLTPEQRKEYYTASRFEARGSNGGKYLIDQCGGVTSPKGEFYCIVTKDSVPHADLALAKKLLIEADEDEFLRTAHKIGGP